MVRGSFQPNRLDRRCDRRQTDIMHRCLHLLMTIALLACPLNCMGALDVMVAPNADCSTCGCCSHHAEHDSAPAQTPHSPVDDCQCPTCLCNGAVVLVDGVQVDLNSMSQHVFAEQWIEDQVSQSNLSSLAAVERADNHAHRAPAGRAACIVHQSFQV